MVDDDYQRMGSLERPQETGRVDNRLTEQLQSAAKLSMFTHFSPEAYKEHIADPTPSISYFVRSFKSSRTDVVLYHIRAHNHDSRVPRKPLSPRLYSYDIGHEHSALDPDAEDHGCALEVDSWLDLTNYGSWPLPLCLLDYIYESMGETRYWETGKRDIQLPDEVSQLLEEWKTEVEHRMP
jgi:hypothetical protein